MHKLKREGNVPINLKKMHTKVPLKTPAIESSAFMHSGIWDFHSQSFIKEQEIEVLSK